MARGKVTPIRPGAHSGGRLPPSQDEIRDKYRALYELTRPRYPDRDHTLVRLREVMAELPEMWRVEHRLLDEWSDEWEAAWRVAQGRKLADADDLSPAFQLEIILRQLERARLDLATAEAAYEEIGPGKAEELIAARRQVQGAFDTWTGLRRQAAQAEQEFRRRTLETPLTGEWARRKDDYVRRLKEEYEGLGEHYDMLCDRTAALHIRLLQMEESGRDIATDEYAEAHKLLLQYVNQLQKYTESMKSESMSKETQVAIEEVLAVVERVVSPSNPALWRNCVLAVKQRVAGTAVA